MKYATKSISRTLIFSLFMLINPLLLFAQPNVPGFIVETYAQQSDLHPTQLSFDSTGVLYVGNNGAYVPIWQIGVGGSPINAYGDSIFDPDAVVIDETGDVASIAGSVLVGSGGGGGNLATIYEILPDETTNILFQAGNLSNPQDMIIDDTGRLLIADAFRGAVLQSTGSAPTVLFSQTLPNEVEVDTSGRIFTGSPSGIQIHDSNGNLIDGSFVTGIDIWGLGFGPSSPPWDGHLFAASFQGKLYRIDEIGTVTEIGTGFNNPLDLKFGPDGAMYVSDFGNNVVYRIVPESERVHSEIIGTWSSGIWYWDVAASSWTQMYSGLPSAAIAAGDFTGDGKADVASIWSSGLWYQNGDSLGWTQVYHTAPDRIAAGDITGDGVDEIIGCGGAWGDSGVWYRDVANGTWHHPWSGSPAGADMAACHPPNKTPDGPIAAGDVTGDGKADMVSCWDSGLWYQDGATLSWTKVWKTAPYKVTCGDVTGDGQAEIIGPWSNGIWYRDVAESKWTKMWSNMPSGDIAAGDFTGDGKDDVASIWSSGLWYQNGATLGWTKVWKKAPYTVAAGDITGVSINLKEGLTAYYPFNGNTNDESGNGYDGIIHGDTSLCKDRFGNSGSAYYFDGNGDYIEIGQEPDVPSWNNYSVSLWFLNDGLGSPSCGGGVGYGEKILDKTVWYHDFMIAICPDEPTQSPAFLKFFTYEGDGDEMKDDSIDYQDNLWHHVVINKADNKGEMWVDGILVDTSNTIKTVYSWGDLLIGYSTSGDSYQRKFWSGKIDDIRIYNRTLSATEIKTLYNLSD